MPTSERPNPSSPGTPHHGHTRGRRPHHSSQPLLGPNSETVAPAHRHLLDNLYMSRDCPEFWHVRDCRCRLRSRHFDADFWRHALSHEAMTQIHPVVQREYMERIFESMDPQDPVVCEAVRRFYVFLTSPYTDASLGWCWSGVGRLWSIGALTGTWQGAFVFPLDPRPFPNRAYTAPENLTILLLHLTIREHVNTVPSTHVKCPTLRM
ncbi:hypothetical protein JB92DRAFT_2114571 [Gautieria morchelliformis]|nr:hypothetical protein JB92DRAFT_2114571 [Gautieria morchelliformis]